MWIDNFYFRIEWLAGCINFHNVMGSYCYKMLRLTSDAWFVVGTWWPGLIEKYLNWPDKGGNADSMQTVCNGVGMLSVSDSIDMLICWLSSLADWWTVQQSQLQMVGMKGLWTLCGEWQQRGSEQVNECSATGCQVRRKVEHLLRRWEAAVIQCWRASP